MATPVGCLALSPKKQSGVERSPLRTLRELSTETVTALTVEAACGVGVAALTSNAYDIPFALLYLLDRDRTQARLAGQPRLPPNRRQTRGDRSDSAETSQGCN